jgi:hypothetical protein
MNALFSFFSELPSSSSVSSTSSAIKSHMIRTVRYSHPGNYLSQISFLYNNHSALNERIDVSTINSSQSLIRSVNAAHRILIVAGDYSTGFDFISVNDVEIDVSTTVKSTNEPGTLMVGVILIAICMDRCICLNFCLL